MEHLKPYYEKAAFSTQVPAFGAMEILVAAWLNDLIRSAPPKREKKTAWLFDSGLYDAIRHGIVRTEALV